MSNSRAVITVATLFDGIPALPLDCQHCNPATVWDNGLCDTCWDQTQARLTALHNHPQVIAVRTQLNALNPAQMRRLSNAYWKHYQTHRQALTSLVHRVRKAYGEHWRDLLSARNEVWAEANRLCDPDSHGAAHAASDAVYAAMAGELLSADEAWLFTTPWSEATP